MNATLRKAARADVGEVIGISLKIDLATRELPPFLRNLKPLYNPARV